MLPETCEICKMGIHLQNEQCIKTETGYICELCIFFSLERSGFINDREEIEYTLPAEVEHTEPAQWVGLIILAMVLGYGLGCVGLIILALSL